MVIFDTRNICAIEERGICGIVLISVVDPATVRKKVSLMPDVHF